MVLEGIPQVGILDHDLLEVLADCVEAGQVQLERIDLVEDPAPHLAGEAVVERRQAAAVFRPVLVVERGRDLGARDVDAADPLHRVAQQAREAQAGGDTEFRRMGAGTGHELPVAGEAEVQPLPAVEEVLVVEADLRREAEQAGGIGGGLHVGLEPHHVRAAQPDVAVHGRAVRGHHLDADVVEDLESRVTVVRRVDHPLAVGLPRADRIELAQQLLPEADLAGVRDAHVADAVLADRGVAGRGLVAGVAPDPVVERRPVRQRVRLEEIMVLVEVVVAEVAEHGRAAHRLGLQVLLREEVPHLDLHVGAVGAEFLPERAAGHVEDQAVDPETAARLHDVLDPGLAAGIRHVSIHLGIVISERPQVVDDVGAGALHQGRVEDHGRLAQLLPEMVNPLVAAVGPVVHVEEGVPSEQDAGVRLLADVGRDFGCAELLLARELHLVGGQTVSPLRQKLCSAA